MYNKTINISIFALLLTCLLLLSCNNTNDPLVYNPILVFPRSLKIDVEPYVYSNADSSVFYKILGDSAIVADTVSSTPEFRWNWVWTELITVIVSKEEFRVSGNKIENTDAIIWQWQSGMEQEKYGKVAYLEGKPVKNEEILYDTTQPSPLESGLYYWAVWSWDNGGREVIYSTKTMKIYVK